MDSSSAHSGIATTSTAPSLADLRVRLEDSLRAFFREPDQYSFNTYLCATSNLGRSLWQVMESDADESRPSENSTPEDNPDTINLTQTSDLQPQTDSVNPGTQLGYAEELLRIYVNAFRLTYQNAQPPTEADSPMKPRYDQMLTMIERELPNAEPARREHVAATLVTIAMPHYLIGREQLEMFYWNAQKVEGLLESQAPGNKTRTAGNKGELHQNLQD
jgi:hypothetical protein